MSTLFSILDMSRRTMQSYQSSIQVTQQNIASADDPKFHRRSPIVRPTPGLPYRGRSALGRAVQLGTGVFLSAVVRERNVFIEKQIRSVDHRIGQYSAIDIGAQRVEILFNEFGGTASLNEDLSEFFNAWEQLAQDPTNAAARADLRAKGDAVASDLRSTYTELEDVQAKFAEDIELRVDRVNSLMEQLIEVHKDLADSRIGPLAPNELLDLRDELVGEISSLIDVKVTENDNQTVTLSLDGRTILQEYETRDLKVIPRSEPGSTTELARVMVEYPGQRFRDVAIKGGELSGLLELQDDLIPDTLNNLDKMAFSMIQRINTIHQGGNSPNGQTGVSFFRFNLPDADGTESFGTEQPFNKDFPPARTAATIDLSAQVESNVNMIAAGIGDGGSNNTIAQQIAGVRNELLFADETTNITDFYSSQVVTLGGRVNENTRLLETAQLVRDQLEIRYQDISGVSLDDELVNIMQFQSIFEAAARVMTTIDGMTDTVINRMAPR